MEVIVSVRMSMMHIRGMSMRVARQLMLMPVAVRNVRGCNVVVAVVMVIVVMPMRMLMCKRVMRMLMAVALHQVQRDACEHQ